MTYDLDALRAAVERLPAGQYVLQNSNSTRRIGTEAPFHDGNVLRGTVAPDGWPDLAPIAHLEAIVTILNAARSGLLDDAALGRAVRAAADWQAEYVEAMGDAMADCWHDGQGNASMTQLAQAAARALVAMQEGR